MIILGLDPGTATTGYGVIRKSKRNLRCIKYGCIETSALLSFSKRLLFLSKEVRSLVKIHHPQIVALETLFFFKNKKTIVRVSQATGVLLLTLGRLGVKTVEYSPQEVKKFLTKNGRAEKEEVQKKVKRSLNLKKVSLKDDAADALALAIYAASKAGI